MFDLTYYESKEEIEKAKALNRRFYLKNVVGACILSVDGIFQVLAGHHVTIKLKSIMDGDQRESEGISVDWTDAQFRLWQIALLLLIIVRFLLVPIYFCYKNAARYIGIVQGLIVILTFIGEFEVNKEDDPDGK